MTREQLKEARLRLGLTQPKMATILMPNTRPDSALRIYSRYETGATETIPGPVEIAICYMLAHGLPVPPLNL